eukprot:g8943.t1
MLGGTVLHKGRSGARGDGDAVGISWKTPTRSHPSPSLVVTCAHQVVVYKPGEERRTHQWSFKPSAATVLSHAAVFLPARSRYIGVQQGSTLVGWRESEQDVKRPLSCQATGPVQAVHACPLLGDYFVAVLASGGVTFYQGGLQRMAHCDAAGGGDDGAGSAVDARAKAVWSGVRGNKVVVLENMGAAADRVSTFALAVERGPSEQPSSSSSRRTKADDAADAAVAGRSSTGGPVSASVTLVSSCLLTKPSRAPPSGSGEDQAEVGEGEISASACSAAFLGRDNAIPGGGGGGGSTVIAVAWRTSSGPVWTKVIVGAGGAQEEFARPAGTQEPANSHHASDGKGNGVVSMSPSNGHGTAKPGKSKAKKPAAGAAHVPSGGKGSVAAGWARVPAIAAADGARLLVHSGGGGGAGPRLAIWDATYGVLLEDGAAPEVSTDDAVPPPQSGEKQTRAIGMKVSGDGAHVALAVAGRVVICPVPVQAAGTLASLLRRKRPSSGVKGGGGSLGNVSGGGVAFPSVDLDGRAPASKLLEQTGTLEAGDWEAAVVTPFRAAEAEVVRSLRDAARRKDGGAFELALREHLQQRAAAAGAGGQSSGEVSGDRVVVSSGGDGGGKKRRRNGRAAAGGYSAGIIAAAVELCLANPHAKLWGALSVLVRSGGVSARHHRGLVTAIVEHASGELLEEVMLHVPDLPEADAVRILRHFVSQAAALAKGPSDPAPAAAAILVPEVPNKASRGGPPAKRARGVKSYSNGGVAVNAAGSPVAQNDGGGGIVVSVLSPSKGKKNGEAAGENDGVGVSGDKSMKVKLKAKKKNHKRTNSMDDGDDDNDADDGEAEHVNSNGNGNSNTVTTNPGLSNGHAAAHDDGRTSSDGGVSDGGDGVETRFRGPKGAGGARNHGGPRETAIATAVAAARAERGVRVALTLPHNEAFLRSALAGLSHGEVVIVLKVLTRLLAEGKTLEASATGAKYRGKNDSSEAKGLPTARTDSVLGWACALLDSHFTRLAIGGSADANLVGALKALKKATREEAECCELLGEVRSLVEEVGRRHAAAAVEEARRRPSRELFTLRVLSF